MALYCINFEIVFAMFKPQKSTVAFVLVFFGQNVVPYAAATTSNVAAE